MQYKKGDHYKSFLITKSIPIEELECHLIELTHEGCGAKIIHIEADDPENFFCLSFRTLPDSSNGVAHILEHTVLCGSERYPAKDPFFSMTRRSLNTFMNALTGADFTCYPAASQIEKDFYNLLDVYIDAVFSPKLDALSFAQEGVRLSYKNPEDPNSPLEYKGIVFNEMKGSLSNPTRKLLEKMSEFLFKGSAYGYNSGGDPKIIPSITHEELIAFHRKHYTPTHCLFFFYGNLPLEGHLDFIEDRILKSAEKASPLEKIPYQDRFTSPLHMTDTYAISPSEYSEDKVEVAFGWLTCSIQDQLDIFALCILDIFLMETDASLLKNRLITSGLCTQAGSMLDVEINEIPFVISLKGCNKKNIQALEHIIRTTLEELAQNGLPMKEIESALHQLEFHKSEISHDYGPFGLLLFYRAGLLTQHNGQAEDGLKIHELFDELREACTYDPLFFQNIIKKYFLENHHFVSLSLEPDTTLLEREEKEEQEKLENIRQHLSEIDRQKILTENENLEQLQEEDDLTAINMLPQITIADISKKSRTINLKQTRSNNLDIFYTTHFTNKITYSSLGFPIGELPYEDLWLVQLFSKMLCQVGACNRSYTEQLSLIQEHTGDISSHIHTFLQTHDTTTFTPFLQLSGKALFHKASHLFSILYDIATEADFTDAQRIQELIIQHYSGLESSLLSNPLRYAVRLATQHIGPIGTLNNLWNGLEYFYKIQQLAKDFDGTKHMLLSGLERMKEHVLSTKNPELVLTTSQTEFEKYLEEDFYGLTTLPSMPHKAWRHHTLPLAPLPLFEGRTSSTKLAFNALGYKGVAYTHQDAPYLSLASSLFDNIVLHKRIREQGGAYGAGSSHNPMTGTFYFYSYRDPNIHNTLESFYEAIDTIAAGKFTLSDIEEAQRELIQALDTPISPGSYSIVAHSRRKEGKTDALRQHFREVVLSSTKESIIHAVQTHLAQNKHTGSFVSFAQEQLLKKEQKKLEKMGSRPFMLKTI